MVGVHDLQGLFRATHIHVAFGDWWRGSLQPRGFTKSKHKRSTDLGILISRGPVYTRVHDQKKLLNPTTLSLESKIMNPKSLH